jgi:hypothetical protein
MSTLQIADNFVNSIVDTVQTVYSAPQTGAVIIESITAANNSGVNASYSLYIKTSTGVLQPIIKDKIVVWGRSDLGIGAVNQAIPAGALLQVKCSAINSIYFTVTGREL